MQGTVLLNILSVLELIAMLLYKPCEMEIQ